MASHIHSIYFVQILTMSQYGSIFFLIVDNTVVIVIDSSFVEQIEKNSNIAKGILLYIHISI
jgi:hypothetical protein